MNDKLNSLPMRWQAMSPSSDLRHPDVYAVAIKEVKAAI